MNLPSGSWESFLESFTRQHHGWLVMIDDSAPQPLDEVRASGRDIDIRAGSVTRHIPNARTIEVTFANESAIERLDIDGTTIRFRTAVDPELVDGMV